MGRFWDPFWGQNGLQKWSKTSPIFWLVFGPLFEDFENPVGRPGITPGGTLSEEVPRAASLAVLLTN